MWETNKEEAIQKATQILKLISQVEVTFSREFDSDLLSGGEAHFIALVCSRNEALLRLVIVTMKSPF